MDMAITSGSATAAPGALIEVRLTAIRYAARDTNLFEFRRLDGSPLPAYEPGAHVDVHLPSGHSRSYSLIVARPEPETYTFGIKRDPHHSALQDVRASAAILRHLLLVVRGTKMDTLGQFTFDALR